MKRTDWIIAAVVGWTVFVGILAMAVQPTDLLCPISSPIGGGQGTSDCLRQLAEVNAASAGQQRVLLFALWIGGLIVGVAFALREIRMSRAPR